MLTFQFFTKYKNEKKGKLTVENMFGKDEE
jgi:hypothetical protein